MNTYTTGEVCPTASMSCSENKVCKVEPISVCLKLNIGSVCCTNSRCETDNRKDAQIENIRFEDLCSKWVVLQ